MWHVATRRVEVSRLRSTARHAVRGRPPGLEAGRTWCQGRSERRAVGRGRSRWRGERRKTTRRDRKAAEPERCVIRKGARRRGGSRGGAEGEPRGSGGGREGER
ncbi:Hypothetical protein CAP_4767 [Chondromyces apiculatus DSM 436]|uniref:Uncharacterized protein n=1 Tax=Chondromyces apiculatus DSM 436 TaxID=1192034 RepID=A0A017T667_9BACT|nr:Hypothetical protein CAP_4767 [Chondromyces apiculatus DSM 436]